MHGLHTAGEIKDWLSRPTKSAHIGHAKTLLRDATLQQDEANHRNTLRQLADTMEAERWKVASMYSAMVLIVPSRLLSFSLSAFIFGLGIYLGFGYTATLIPEFGRTGSLAILIIYIGVTTLGLTIFYIPDTLKGLEADIQKEAENIVVQLRERDLGPPVPAMASEHTSTHTSGNQKTPQQADQDLEPAPQSVTSNMELRAALESFIRIQEESAVAGRNLLKELRGSG